MKKIYKIFIYIYFACFFFSGYSSFSGDTLVWYSPFKTNLFSHGQQTGSQRLINKSNFTNHLKSYHSSALKGIGDDIGVPIVFSGSFRFNAMYRDLYEPYVGVKPKSLNIGGFGDGSLPLGSSPLLTLFSKISPSPGIDMGIGMGFSHIFSGSLDHDSTRGRFPFGQTFGAYAVFKTGIGNIRIGGGNLYTGMSQLFSGWSTVRWNPFYRLPWDVSAQWGGSWNYYENTYTNGSATNFDAAYTSGGRTSGVILQLSELPGNFGLNVSYGVDGQTGIYQSTNNLDLVANTKKTIGGRAYKKIKEHIFGLTGILNNGYVNNVANFRETQYMYSGDVYLVFSKVIISSEMGATAFTSPYGKYNGDSAFYKLDTMHYRSGTDFLAQVKIRVKKEVLGMPVILNLYQLGANYINLNSGAYNTSTYNNAAAYIQINSNWDVATRKGFIADVGQTANNRRAFELATQYERGRLKAGIATQVGSEIEKANPTQNQVMFYHHLNPWSRAQYNYWNPTGGPYQRLLSNFIQLLEKVNITDSTVNYRKTFNVFNLDTRYKTSLFRRSLILTNYNSYQSVSDKYSPLPYFSKHAFVRVFYEEFTAYYQLLKNTVLVGHAAFNKAVGNNRTTLSIDNSKPINQRTWGVGGGVDWNFAPMMGLYFRGMWMDHKDKNFLLDHFKEYEFSIELKVMF